MQRIIYKRKISINIKSLIMEINSVEKKDLIENIQKISVDQQRQVFFILRKVLERDMDNKWYTKNQNGIFINLSNICDSVITDIKLYVKECFEKYEILKKLEEEIQLTENKEICYKIASIDDNNEKEDFEYLYKIIGQSRLNEFMDNINLTKKNKKKQNLQTKFINATKRYNKSANTEKKIDDSVIYFLDYEPYIEI